jgi:hypothetical protein
MPFAPGNIEADPRDPNFAAKAGPILDLYQRVWEGAPLGADDYVICADEKTSIQARRRKQPTLPPAPNRPTHVEHEYFRLGAWTYLAAWDVHRARVFGCGLPNSKVQLDSFHMIREEDDFAGSVRKFSTPHFHTSSVRMRPVILD